MGYCKLSLTDAVKKIWTWDLRKGVEVSRNQTTMGILSTCYWAKYLTEETNLKKRCITISKEFCVP